jgi:uncharacterized phage protein (TIGR02220 family)
VKILLDPSLVQSLIDTYGPKAPKVLFDAVTLCRDNAFLDQDINLTYEEVIRRTKVSQRIAVAENENARDILNYMNKVTGKKFKMLDINLKPIVTLLKSYTREEIQRVIDNKTSKWKGTDMEDYLRPATLFKGKFDSYLNEAPSIDMAEKNLANELDALLDS